MLKDLKANSGDASRFNIDVNPLPEINTDAQLLKILLLNLFNNALKYSKPESMIDVEAAHWHEDGYDFLQVMVVNDPGAAGMPDPEKVFSKFYRSAGAKKQSGSGLGLYLFKSFAILLGGKVRYDTFKGKVRFTVWITA
jgi:signal transduction histidine kinase